MEKDIWLESNKDFIHPTKMAPLRDYQDFISTGLRRCHPYGVTKMSSLTGFLSNVAAKSL